MFVSLLTRGAPDQLTGGYLYHRRVAALAEGSGDRIDFVPVRRLASPYAQASGDVILVDSIAAAAVAPWRSPAQPLAAIIHQPPGGIDASRPLRAVQAALDRSLYRRCELLIAASEALGQELAAAPNKLPVDRIVVVPPGCDPTPPRSTPASDLRRGRRVALVSVGNWIPRKGTLDLLAAFSRLAQDRATLHLAGRDDIDRSYARRAVRRMQPRPTSSTASSITARSLLNRLPPCTRAPTRSFCRAIANPTEPSTARHWRPDCR